MCSTARPLALGIRETPGAHLVARLGLRRDEGGAALLNGRRRHQHVSARFVVVRGVGGVHGVENVGRLHPDRRVLVARDVEDEEAVGFCVIGGERRNMAADLLPIALRR